MRSLLKTISSNKTKESETPSKIVRFSADTKPEDFPYKGEALSITEKEDMMRLEKRELKRTYSFPNLNDLLYNEIQSEFQNKEISSKFRSSHNLSHIKSEDRERAKQLKSKLKTNEHC